SEFPTGALTGLRPSDTAKLWVAPRLGVLWRSCRYGPMVDSSWTASAPASASDVTCRSRSIPSSASAGAIPVRPNFDRFLRQTAGRTRYLLEEQSCNKV